MYTRQKLNYSIDLKTKQCNKTTLNSPFSPIEVPSFANFTDSVYLGVPGLVGTGVLENIYQGNTSDGGRFLVAMVYKLSESPLVTCP